MTEINSNTEDWRKLILTDGDIAKRERDVERLKKWVDFLEANPEFPSPFDTEHIGISFYDGWSWRFEADRRLAKDQMKSARRIAGGKWEKAFDDFNFSLSGEICGSNVVFYAPRDQVCERVVVGTEKVIEMEYPEDAFIGVEKVPVEKERLIVEWVCPESLSE